MVIQVQLVGYYSTVFGQKIKSVDHDLCISVSHLSNESADIQDVINSNWEFDVSLILSHASNLNSFGLNPTVQIVKSEH